jgi:translation initiation factor IF-2
MAEVTVEQLAKQAHIAVDVLLGKLKQAGLPQTSADDLISNEQKMALFKALQPKKVILKERKSGQVSLGGANKGRRVDVQVKKKRTYVSSKDRLITEDESNRIAAEEEAKKKAEEEAKLKEEQTKVEALKAQQEKELKEQEDKDKKEADLQGKDKPALDKEAESKKPGKEVGAKEPSETIPPKPAEDIETVKSKLLKEEEEELKKLKPKPKIKDKSSSSEPAYITHGGRILVPDDKKDSRRPKLVSKRRRTAVYDGRGSSKVQKFEKPKESSVIEVGIPETITVADLAQKMSVKAAKVVKVLMGLGMMATVNESLDQDTAVLVVEQMGHKYKLLQENALEVAVIEEQKGGKQVSRAPVVTIMGHVDHGKTSLLDYIRRTKVASGESGGITQHIGAYNVAVDKGNITFLDTPGHEAFTAMRARGATCTDIVILVVAADDGVMPQTIEAINHAKAAGVPIIVAVNKIDKPESDVEKMKTDVSNHGVVPEDWGGENMFVPVSAKTGEGVDSLLESVLLQAEVLELTSVVDVLARGIVLESRIDKNRGVVASVLVQKGTLSSGNIVLAGSEYGRVRSMFNELGKKVKEAGPSMPVEVLGLSGTPKAGDDFIVVKEERKAREVAEFRKHKTKEQKQQLNAVNLENIFEAAANEAQKLNIILKADVQGSQEAIIESLNKIATDEIQVEFVATSLGGINESDVNLALASSAIIFGFNTRAELNAKRLAEQEGVEIRYYSVIYDLIDDIKQSLSGMLKPEIRENIIGTAEVRDVFKSPKFGAIAGCMVIDGNIKRNLPIRVIRDGTVIYEGVLESLRHFKDDVSDVRQGKECGIGVKNYNDVKTGDQIEVYEKVEIARKLD